MGASGDNLTKRFGGSGPDYTESTVPAHKKVKVTDATDWTAATDAVGFIPRGISVNIAGDVDMQALNDDTDDLITLTAGVIHPIAVKSITGATTTATGVYIWG